MKLPPSSLIVLTLLNKGEALTHKEIATLTGLPPRTVRYALQKLREGCLIREEWNFKDARQIRYRNNGGEDKGNSRPDLKIWRPGRSCKSSFPGAQ
jgi:transcription initiation factor IIE alpha subunit